MGDPDVFSCQFCYYIGVAIQLTWYNNVPNIQISLPFFKLWIYCHKDKYNKWFGR